MNNEFSHLTLQELEEMWLYVDKERYPENAQRIKNEIRIRRKGLNPESLEVEKDLLKQEIHRDPNCDDVISNKLETMIDGGEGCKNPDYYVTPGIPNSTLQRLARELKYGWALYVSLALVAIPVRHSTNYSITPVATVILFIAITAHVYLKSIRKSKIILGNFAGIGVDSACGAKNGATSAKAYINFESGNTIYRYYGKFVQQIPRHFSVRLEVDDQKRVLGYEIIK